MRQAAGQWRVSPPRIYFGFSEIGLDGGVDAGISRSASRLRSKGRFAIVSDVGCGMRWTRVAACDERCQRGRPRRVVLAPRRWCQVLKKLTLLRDDGGNKARSPRRARYTPLKPLRGECRVNRCDRGDYARMLILFCMRGCGRIERPAFPAPSASGGTMFVDDSGAIARRERGGAW